MPEIEVRRMECGLCYSEGGNVPHFEDTHFEVQIYEVCSEAYVLLFNFYFPSCGWAAIRP